MPMNLLLGFIPLSLLLKYVTHAPPLWVFATAVLAIVPLADWLRKATEHVAAHAGPTIGGLLNVTFGNMAELIIAIFILLDGNVQVVKAQITGSIIGNALLGLGLAIVAAGFVRGGTRQKFNAANAGQLSAMLFLTVITLTLPAIFDYTEQLPGFATGAAARAGLDERLSIGVAVLLIVVYLLNLVYTLVTHKDVFAVSEEAGHGHGPEKPWPLVTALGVLLGGTLLIALESEMLSGALEATASQLGLSEFFLGVIVLAVVGNFAEYIAAVYFARRGQMDLAVNIGLGATIQVALLTAPLLVLIGAALGHPMDLVFSSPLELIAIIAVALIVTSVTKDGETTWFEGVLLLAVYLALAMAFFFVTPRAAETEGALQVLRALAG
ncbi:calcium/proton exchanger [Deinococcus multiflagellatus]|uniref:Ca(2+)/H(+) antiporter n=1 Tax=Deinococcus multiflagellatus TaxID=1656887 RepID=A0ABW1ZME9_9DEIO|nr:calcium/proton exchanger [Deinococcus multiflagellatus]MBZ9714151.1 calcium/proton exchanger [Deinococcus multiflagellatus]